jgi:hypothetical protein
MYTPGPSSENIAKMRYLGFEPEDYVRESVEVWPENERAYFLFLDLQTQWRVGMGGATGLDYLVLFAKLDRMKLSDEEVDELEQDIRTMEHEALRVMAERE